MGGEIMGALRVAVATDDDADTVMGVPGATDGVMTASSGTGDGVGVAGPCAALVQVGVGASPLAAPDTRERSFCRSISCQKTSSEVASASTESYQSNRSSSSLFFRRLADNAVDETADDVLVLPWGDILIGTDGEVHASTATLPTAIMTMYGTSSICLVRLMMNMGRAFFQATPNLHGEMLTAMARRDVSRGQIVAALNRMSQGRLAPRHVPTRRWVAIFWCTRSA